MGESQRETHWRQHIARWRASGLTQQQYSRRAGLNAHTLAHWSWRLGRQAAAAGQSLVPVRVIAPAPPAAPVVELRTGSWCVQVPSTFHYDGLGSTRLLTDAGGNLVDQYAYEAFGQSDDAAGVLATPNLPATNYPYTGEQFDPNLGLYYMRARYTDPAVGRFTQQDSFKGVELDPLTLHKYTYGNNNPTCMVDPARNVSVAFIMASVTVVAIGVTVVVADYAMKRVDKGRDVYVDFSGMNPRCHSKEIRDQEIMSSLQIAFGQFCARFTDSNAS